MISKTPLIIKKSRKGSDYTDTPKTDVPQKSLQSSINKSLLRDKPIILPEISEPEVVRHYVKLSTKNHHVDKDFYPLGSCTMKYNPKINDKVASDPTFADIHPDQHAKTVQGHLELQYKLEKMLNDITGMHSTTLQPSAGSQGEFVGLLIMQKYHKKNPKKKYIIIPESAHGTNPASVILAGFEVIQIGTNQSGCVDIDDLKSKINDQVAGMMLTQPNTLGIFEKDIKLISKMIHDVDGLLYMDGANLNAMLGLCRPADMGFDIVHMNVHKTFSTPHGGGGPGAGPIGVVKKLAKYLPYPVITEHSDTFNLNYSHKKTSIGKIHSFFGNTGVLVRAYCYIKSLGSSGLVDVSLNAIINANYIKHRLKESYIIPFAHGTMHEFVISAKKQKESGLKALDIAKIVLDYGFHAPTIYFPINIPESIMIEPTETESKKTLDSFINLMLDIDEKIELDLENLLDSPKNTPVRRLNETKANRELNLNWRNEL